jgi:hypothetical protein
MFMESELPTKKDQEVRRNLFIFAAAVSVFRATVYVRKLINDSGN